jgi:hypothetical protein
VKKRKQKKGLAQDIRTKYHLFAHVKRGRRITLLPDTNNHFLGINLFTANMVLS